MMNEKLTNLKNDVEARINALNDAITAKKDADTIADCKQSAEEALALYNNQLVHDMYDNWLEQEDPMITALTVFFYEVSSLKAVKDKDKGNITGYELGNRKETLSMSDFAEYAPKQIVVNGQWVHEISCLAYALGLKAAEKIGADTGKYATEHIAAKIAAKREYGFDIAISNTKLKKVLQDNVDMIAFVPKEKDAKLNAIEITSDDVNYIILLMCNEDKTSLKTRLPKIATVERLLGKAMHRIITKRGYSIDYEKAPNKKH